MCIYFVYTLLLMYQVRVTFQSFAHPSCLAISATEELGPSSPPFPHSAAYTNLCTIRRTLGCVLHP